MEVVGCDLTLQDCDRKSAVLKYFKDLIKLTQSEYDLRKPSRISTKGNSKVADSTFYSGLAVLFSKMPENLFKCSLETFSSQMLPFL